MRGHSPVQIEDVDPDGERAPVVGITLGTFTERSKSDLRTLPLPLTPSWRRRLDRELVEAGEGRVLVVGSEVLL
jgi:hypothetical protein